MLPLFRSLLLIICLVLGAATPFVAEAQDLLACSCTGESCGDGGVAANQGDVFIDVTQNQVDSLFTPTSDTGWTCVVPTSIRGSGGPKACFCEASCGNGGVGGDPDSFFLGRTDEQIDEFYGGGGAGNQTGWLCGDYLGMFDPENVPDPRTLRINAGLNDAWYDPQTDGQGFYLTVFEDAGVMALAWFTFALEASDANDSAELGGAGQRWLVAAGGWDGTVATLPLVNTTGGRFDATAPAVDRDDQYGTLTVEFHDCDSATVDYEIPGLALSGTIEITRVAKENVSLCETLSGL